MVHDDELGGLLPTFLQPGGRRVHRRDAGLLAARVVERRGGVGRGDDAPVHEDAGVKAALRRPLEHLDAELAGELAVEEGLAVHPPDHRAAVADHGVGAGEAEALRVLAGPLEAPARSDHEPHPPLPEPAQGLHGPVRYPQVPAQHRPVEVEGAQLEGQTIPRTVLLLAQDQPSR
jgi:hypothetical protein